MGLTSATSVSIAEAHSVRKENPDVFPLRLGGGLDVPLSDPRSRVQPPSCGPAGYSHNLSLDDGLEAVACGPSPGDLARGSRRHPTDFVLGWVRVEVAASATVFLLFPVEFWVPRERPIGGLN